MTSAGYTNRTSRKNTTLKTLLSHSFYEFAAELDEHGNSPSCSDIIISGVTDDSKEVEPGSVFVAYTGSRRDGHHFVEEAIHNGAGAIVVEKPVEAHSDVPIIQVNNGRKALSKLTSAYYNHPSKHLVVIGITGTNGKTTTTTLIDHLLAKGGVGTGLIGTVYYAINGQRQTADLTTPKPGDLYQYMKDMITKGAKYLTMEVSSHGLKEERVSAIDFDIAGITNLSTDHVNFHHSWKDYCASKAKLFQMLQSRSFSIINADDSEVLRLGDQTKSQVITYGLQSKGAMVMASDLDLEGFQTTFTLDIQEELPTLTGKLVPPGSYQVSAPLPGKHNTYNLLLALTSAIIAGVSPEEAIERLETFPGVFRRMEIIYNGTFTVLDDCAHNPRSLHVVFQTIQQLPYNQLVIINGIRGNRGTDINRKNAQTLAHWIQSLDVRKTIITPYRNLSETKNRVQDEEQQAFLSPLKDRQVPYSFIDDLDTAVSEGLKHACKNDLVLILGPTAMNQAQEIARKKLKQTPDN